MSLPNTYSLKTTSIPLYFEGMLKANIPDTFDAAFMARLGFHYAIDRSFIDILKELHFLSDAGMPTKRYFDFHGRTAAKETLLKGIHEACSKLLDAQPDAFNLPAHQLLDSLKELYAGKKTDMMVSGIARTFTALYRYATQTDFTLTATPTAEENAAPDTTVTPEASRTATPDDASPSPEPETAVAADEPGPLVLVPEPKPPVPNGETPPPPATVLPPQPATATVEQFALELETKPGPPIQTRTTPPPPSTTGTAEQAEKPTAPEEVRSTVAPEVQPQVLIAPVADATPRTEVSLADRTPAANSAACAEGSHQGPAAGTIPDKAPPDTRCIDNGANDNLSCPIQIVLPASSDVAVYDAIFSSLRRNLLAAKT